MNASVSAKAQHGPNVFDTERPAYLMNVPFSLSAEVPNNVWMSEIDDSDRLISRDKAITQFFNLYREVSRYGIIYLLPSAPGLQDQPYVSNLGVVLPHLPQCTVVISRFRSPPRTGEAAVGRRFFEMMNVAVVEPPERFRSSRTQDHPMGHRALDDDDVVFFEGEADLKYLVDNVYVGAHGLRTSRSAHHWFSDTFGMTVIPYRISNERMYHLDCCVLPITPQRAAVCTEAVDGATVEEIGNHVEILDVPLKAALYGTTNCLVVRDKILFSSNIGDLSETHRHYSGEKAKIDMVERIANMNGMEAQMFDLSEFNKSGADLSCLIMNLNYREYQSDRA